MLYSIPFIYHDVVLWNVNPVQTCISTLQYHSRSVVPRSHHIRRFSIQVEVDVPELVTKIIAVLLDCLNLQSLTLLASDTHFLDMLRGSNFAKLSLFHLVAASTPSLSTALPEFFNRHPAIPDLHLYRGSHWLEPVLDLILLPNLKIYSGPTLFIPCLVSTYKFIELVDISCYAYNIPDMEEALATFARMAFPTIGGVTRGQMTATRNL
ncbi:hypothetical protein C8R43DRAFT_674334 [Mycena crocata]|nr:hypothetical protein C8R43DRAFT_674334 [Mycena crocata]